MSYAGLNIYQLVPYEWFGSSITVFLETTWTQCAVDSIYSLKRVPRSPDVKVQEAQYLLHLTLMGAQCSSLCAILFVDQMSSTSNTTQIAADASSTAPTFLSSNTSGLTVADHIASFSTDPRIAFNKVTGKWEFEDDDGNEMEWDMVKNTWVPVVRTARF